MCLHLEVTYYGGHLLASYYGGHLLASYYGGHLLASFLNVGNPQVNYLLMYVYVYIYEYTILLFLPLWQNKKAALGANFKKHQQSVV